MSELDFITGTVSIDGVEVVDKDKPLEFPTVGAVLDRWGARLVTDLQQSALQHRASGELERSIDFAIEHEGEVYNFELYLNDYYKYVDEEIGRAHV